VGRVLMLVAQPEEHYSNPVATKRMLRLDDSLSPAPAGGAQRAVTAMVEARAYYLINMRLHVEFSVLSRRTL